jgi:hypothetical protein
VPAVCRAADPVCKAAVPAADSVCITVPVSL